MVEVCFISINLFLKGELRMAKKKVAKKGKKGNGGKLTVAQAAKKVGVKKKKGMSKEDFEEAILDAIQEQGLAAKDEGEEEAAEWAAENADLLEFYNSRVPDEDEDLPDDEEEEDESDEEEDEDEEEEEEPVKKKAKKAKVEEEDEEDEEEEEDSDEDEDEDEDEEDEPVKKAKKAKKAKAKAKAKKLDEKKKKVKKSKGKNGNGELSCFGHKLDSIRGFIDELVAEGTTLKDAVKKIAKKFDRDNDYAEKKFKGYVKYLERTLGVEVKEKDGFYKSKKKTL